jgi:hypothetical protein
MFTTLETATQICLNRIELGPAIGTDGILGRKESIPRLGLLDKYLEKKYKDLGYWNSIEQYEYLGIRTGKKYTNRFSDVAVMWVPGSPEKTRLVEMSTLPGLYGSGSITSPNLIPTRKFKNGYKGTAVLQPGRYKDTWYLVNKDGSIYGGGYFRQWSGGPYLMQEKSVLIGRDGNLDNVIDPQVFETDNNGAGGAEFGINHHGWINCEADIVNTISLGCQVFQQTRLYWLYSYWVKMLDYDNVKRITYTLLEK